MSKFPQVNNKNELDTLLTQIHDGVENKGKWLTRDVKLIKKSSCLTRIIKISLNIFPGDRFKKIRAHNTAQGLAAFCLENKHLIDQSISQKACAILDLLKEKTKKSRKKICYAQEIEKAKAQIRALVTNSQTSQKPIGQVFLTPESQDFRNISEAENLVIDLKITPEQENEIKKAVEASSAIKNITFSPAAAKENESLVKFIKSKPTIKFHIDENLSKDKKEQTQPEPTSPQPEPIRTIPLAMLTADSQDFASIAATENLVIDFKLTAEQENQIKKVIETSSAIKKVIFSPTAAKENESLMQFVQDKPTIKLLIDEQLSSDTSFFLIGNRYSSDVLSKKNADIMLSQLQSRIGQIETLHLEAQYNSEQEKKLADLILQAPKLTKFRFAPGRAGNLLLQALSHKKTLSTVTAYGCDQWIKTLSQSHPTLKNLSIIPGGTLNLSEEGIKDLEKFSEIKKFFIADSFFFEGREEMVAKTVLKFKNLKMLSLCRDDIFLKAYVDLVENESKISGLKLLFCKDTLKHLTTLADKKCTIDKIYLSLFHETPDLLLPVLARLSPKKLNINHCNMTHEEYKKLEQLTSLEELHTHYPSNGGEYEIIEKLLAKLPKLKKVIFFPTMCTAKFSEGHAIRTESNSLLAHEQKKLQAKFPHLDIQAIR